MRCSHCQTELPDSAISCSHCGQSTHREDTTYFSYLPAGTPPWPTTIPPHLSTANASALSALSAATTSKQHHRRSASHTLLIIAILILTPLIGVGLTLGTFYMQGGFSASHAAPIKASSIGQSQSNTPGTQNNQQLPTPTSFKTLLDQDVNVTLQYPSDWQKDPTQKTQTVNYLTIRSTAPSGIAFIFNRFSSQTSQQFSSAANVNNTQLQGLSGAQGINNLQASSTSTQQTIANTQWTQTEGTFVDDNGNSIHLLLISVQHNKIYYNIIIVIPQLFYSEATQKYNQPILNSFQFLS